MAAVFFPQTVGHFIINSARTRNVVKVSQTCRFIHLVDAVAKRAIRNP